MRYNGVFRISLTGARRRRRREGLSVEQGANGHAPPQEKIILSPKVWVHFNPVFNRQKTRTVTRKVGTPILRFNRETKLTKTVKNYPPKKSWQTKGAVTPAPPPFPLNTSLVRQCDNILKVKI